MTPSDRQSRFFRRAEQATWVVRLPDHTAIPLTPGLVVGRESPDARIAACLGPRYADVSRRHLEFLLDGGRCRVVSRSQRSETTVVANPAAGLTRDQRLDPDTPFPLPSHTAVTLRLGDHCFVAVDPA
jgi:hypothetical protein